MSDFFITTPIYYVNDHPHIGHIYSTIVADTIARYRRLHGDRVYFLTGTDEHGQNIERAAAKRGIEPIELADEVVARYHELWAQMGLTHDDFVRTTEARHALGVREIIERIAAAGDFYVSHHEGWYCPRCETFYTEKELPDDRRCPIHESPCEERSEENIFFRLSKYEKPLLELYEKQPDFVLPRTRANEVKQFVASGLRDLSVSRTTVNWGIPFPEHEGHTIYVWLDALTNYISALGFGSEDRTLYDRHWQGDGRKVHLVGKDILRFHAVYWPAFLMSAGLPLPDTVWAHGWWLRDEKKISKSVGNLVRPDDLVKEFGVDSLRFFLLREMAFGQDAQFSDEGFIDRYNSDLANDLGNTVSRLVTLSRSAFEGHLPPETGDGLRVAAEQAISEYRSHMDAFAFHDALKSLWRLMQEVSQFLVQAEPWKKLKDPEARGEVSQVLWASMEAVRLVTCALLPILPEKAPQVLASLGAEVPDNLVKSLEWGGLPTGRELSGVSPLFPRANKKAYLANSEGTEPTSTEGKGQNKAQAKASAKAAPKAAPKTSTKKHADDGLIGIDHFFESVLKVGRVLAAAAVPRSDKLLQLTIDLGEEAPRTVVAGLAKRYDAEALVGESVIVVANLKPAKLMGVESNGMVLAASDDQGPVLIQPSAEVAPGTRVK